MNLRNLQFKATFILEFHNPKFIDPYATREFCLYTAAL
jgi:hypothetical protein